MAVVWDAEPGSLLFGEVTQAHSSIKNNSLQHNTSGESFQAPQTSLNKAARLQITKHKLPPWDEHHRNLLQLRIFSRKMSSTSQSHARPTSCPRAARTRHTATGTTHGTPAPIPSWTHGRDSPQVPSSKTSLWGAGGEALTRQPNFTSTQRTEVQNGLQTVRVQAAQGESR